MKTKKSKILLLILMFVLLVNFFSTKVEAKELPSGINYDDIKNEIDSYIEKNQETTVGLATILYDEDGIIYQNLYGYIDKENKIPVDENSVFEWGSTSKLLIWVSVMQLEEQGKIDLNKDIREYLPENFLKLTYDKKITMLDLMNHQAGFQEVYIGLSENDRNKVMSLEEALKKYQPMQAFEPGQYTAYSNYGASLAAYIVERITKMDYVEYVHKNIFDVLDMKDTTIGAKLEDNEEVFKERNKLKVYDLKGEFLGDKISYINFYPAGSGTGTLSDFYKFARAITPNSKIKCPLFKKEDTLNKLLSPTSYYGSSKVPNNFHGFFASQFKVDTLGHGGNTFGSSAMIQFDPISKVGMIVFVNQAHEKIYNYDMYELVFGNFKDSQYNSIERCIPDGFVINTRGIFKGPFKFMSAIALSGFDEEDLNSWWYKEGNIVYGGFSDSYIDSSKIVLNLVIFILFIIGTIYSSITTVSFVVHLFIKKKQSLNKYNYLLNSFNCIILINTACMFMGIANGSVTGVMPNYEFFKFRIFITLILFIAILICLVVAIYKWSRNWKDISNKTKAKYIITTIFMIITIIALIYFDMYEFWNL